MRRPIRIFIILQIGALAVSLLPSRTAHIHWGNTINSKAPANNTDSTQSNATERLPSSEKNTASRSAAAKLNINSNLNSNTNSKTDAVQTGNNEPYPFSSTNTTATADTDPRSATARVRSILAQIHETKKCLQSQTCNYPQEDARSYDFAVHQDLSAKLGQLQTLSADEHVVSDDISKLARDILDNGDGWSKSQAIELLSTQPVSDENLASLLNGVFQDHDVNLISSALNEMQRYQGDTKANNQITHEILSQLQNGSLMVREKLALEAHMFINKNNRESFKALAENLPRESVVRKRLLSEIEEWDLQQSNG